MTNTLNFASERARSEASAAIEMALRERSKPVRRAWLRGTLRNVRSAAKRHSVTTALAIMLMVAVVFLGFLAVRLYSVTAKEQLQSHSSERSAMLDRAEAKRPVPPSPVLIESRASDLVVQDKELSGTQPVLKMDYQLSQPTPKGTHHE